MLQMVPLFYHKTDFASLHRQMVDGLPIVIYTEIIPGSPLDNDRFKSTICHVVYCFLPFANLMSTTDHLTAQVLSQTVKSFTSLWTFV